MKIWKNVLKYKITENQYDEWNENLFTYIKCYVNLF